MSSARPENRGSRGWYVCVVVSGKRRRRKVGPPGPEGEAAAHDFCAAWEQRERRSTLWANGAYEPLPANEALRAWLATYGPTMSLRTSTNARSRVAMLAEFLGEKDLRDLTETDARRFCASGRERYSGETLSGALSVLRRALNVAVQDGILERHPIPTLHRVMRDVRTQGMSEVRTPDAWHQGEVDRMLETARREHHHLALALLVAFHTGCRRGELLTLRWEDVEFAHWPPRLWVRRAAELGGGKTKVPKSGRARFVPISTTLAEALREERQRQTRAQLQRGPEPQWVCPSPSGRLWLERNFSRTFEQFRRKWFTRLEIRPLNLHCTRHSFITNALTAGTPAAALAKWVGCSIRVIEERYAHVIPEAHGVEFLDAGHQKATKRHQGKDIGRRHVS